MVLRDVALAKYHRYGPSGTRDPIICPTNRYPPNLVLGSYGLIETTGEDAKKTGNITPAGEKMQTDRFPGEQRLRKQCSDLS